eukprot:284493-Hanusia_phi.AAC.1
MAKSPRRSCMPSATDSSVGGVRNLETRRGRCLEDARRPGQEPSRGRAGRPVGAISNAQRERQEDGKLEH